MSRSLPYETILSSMREAVYVRDRNRKLLYMNRAAELLTGWRFDEVGDRPCSDVFGDPEGKCAGCCPAEKALECNQGTTAAEGLLRIRDGKVAPVRCSVSPLVEDGEETGVIVVMEDISALRLEEVKRAQTMLRLEKEVDERKRDEEDIREALNRFEAVLTGTPMVSIQSFDRHGAIRHWNPASTRLYGYEHEEVIGKRIQDLVLEASERPAFEEQIQEIWDSGKASPPAEWEVTTRKGEKRWVYSTIFPVFGGRDVVELFCMDVDITDRKRAEESLEQERNFVSALLETSGAMFVVLDEEGRIVRFNSACEEATGYSFEEARGRKVWDFLIPPEEIEEVKGVFEELRGGDFPNKFENCWLTKSGEKRVVAWQNTCLTDRNGRVSHVMGAGIDVTERKKAEEELRETLSKYSDLADEQCFLLDNMSDFVYRHDTQGVFYYLSPAVEHITGYPIEEWRRHYSAFMTENPLNRHVSEATERAIQTGEKMPPYLVEIWHKNGNRLTLEVNEQPFFEDGAVAGIVGVARDVTARIRAEAALRQSEEFFRLATEAAKVGVWEWNFKTDAAIWSEGVEPLFGLEKGTFKKTYPAFLDLVIPEDVENVKEKVSRAVEEQSQYYCEYRVKWSDGSIRCQAARGRVIKDHDGRPQGMTGTVVDITERKRAEDELKKLHEEWNRILASISDYVWSAPIESGEVRGKYYSPAVKKITGYAPEEYAADPEFWLERVLDEDQPRVKEAIQKIMEGTPAVEEYRIVRKDGAIRWVRDSASPRLDESGRVVSVDGVVSDITPRKNAEKALADSEHEHRLILDQMQEAVLFADAEGKVRNINSFAVRLLGLDRETAIGKNLLDLHPDKDRETVREMIETFKKRPDSEAVVLQRTLREMEIIMRFSPVRSSAGEFDGIIANLIDITETRRLEKQLLQAQKMESLGTLAGGFAHDFNNQLNVILGFTSLILLKTPKDDPEFESLTAIKEQADKAAKLARQLLTLSRGGTYEKRPIDLNAIVRDLCDVLGSTFHKNIQLEQKLDPDLWLLVADGNQIQQALMNLSINARDAMPKGGVLAFRTSNEFLSSQKASRCLDARPGPYVCLTVSDNGVGMDEETRARIFDPFFTTKELGKGTGLGLAMTRRIVIDHGGFIRVFSHPGLGSSFKIYLPSASEEIELALETRAEAIPPRGSETVLVIDDEETNRRLVKAVLEDHGYRVATAPDGLEGLEIFKAEKGAIKLVVVDLIMPGMGGEEVCREIERFAPHTPVVLSSGYSQTGVPEELLNDTVRFLSKPYNAESLLNTVRKTLDAAARAADQGRRGASGGDGEEGRKKPRSGR